MAPAQMEDHFTEVIGTKFTDVELEGCEFDDVKIQDCDWKNVRFVNCKARRVVFAHTNLHDVRFEDVDFDNVRFLRMTHTRHLWQHLCVHNTLLSDGSISETWTPGVQFRSQFTYRPIFTAELIDYNHCIRAPDPESQKKLTPTFTNLPAAVLKRILRAVFGRDTIYIYDYSEHHPAIRGSKQTTYTTKTKGDLFSGRHNYSTTYFGSRRAVDQSAVDDRLPLLPRLINFDTSILKVSGAVYRVTARYLYGRVFRFQCSAEGAAAFMKDHRRDMCRLKRLCLWYHLPSPRGPLATNDGAWRKLMASIRHDHYDVKYLTLYIGEVFWDAASWEQGADTVFNQTNINCISPWRGNEEDEKNFLGHVAKLASRKYRDRDYTEGATGCELKLVVAGAEEDVEKKRLEKELREYLYTKMGDRPLLDGDND